MCICLAADVFDCKDGGGLLVWRCERLGSSRLLCQVMWIPQRDMESSQSQSACNCVAFVVEMSAAQSSRSVEEVWAHAAMAEEDKKLGQENWRETIVASCPNCNAPLATNAKFCPECGTKLKVTLRCRSCEAVLTPGAKFCPECGEKV